MIKKAIYITICFALLLINCKSSPVKSAVGMSRTSANTYTTGTQNIPQRATVIPETTVHMYRNIPVEVIGIPYGFNDINGNHTIDYLIDTEYNMISTSQQSRFINLKINKFIFDFKNDGSLILNAVYSYDKTPSEGNRFYPAKSNEVHEWRLEPAYHKHLGKNCSLDRYDDVAVSQAKLNEMKKDSSLRQVYDILLSVAQDIDYDYNRIGIRVTFVTPTPLRGVCDDYSNLLIQRLREANIAGVSTITKISGQDHAWVTLHYNTIADFCI